MLIRLVNGNFQIKNDWNCVHCHEAYSLLALDWFRSLILICIRRDFGLKSFSVIV